MRTILSIIEHGIGALCGALQSAAVKGEIDCTPEMIAALRKALKDAAEKWWYGEINVTDLPGNIREYSTTWQGTENPNAEPQP